MFVLQEYVILNFKAMRFDREREGHRTFGGTYCLHLQVKDKGDYSSKRAVSENRIYVIWAFILIRVLLNYRQDMQKEIQS